jgi:Tfp pilus assembly protein PilV
MVEKKATNLKGLTIIELMIAVVFLGIAILGIGIVLADSHRGWNAMYDRVYSDVVTDSHIARRMFDGIVRKASRNHIAVDADGGWAEVLYYADITSTDLDRYARFYTANGELYIEYGTLDPKETLRTQTVCSNVSSCVFTRAGGAVQMILRLDNGSEAATVATSAIAHN